MSLKCELTARVLDCSHLMERQHGLPHHKQASLASDFHGGVKRRQGYEAVDIACIALVCLVNSSGGPAGTKYMGHVCYLHNLRPMTGCLL